MAKDKCPECPKCLPGWLVQFGDLMSLLLTFFILLLSMAVMDKKKVEEYFDVMKKAMGFIDASTDVQTQSDAHSTQNSSSEAEDSDSTTEEAVEEAAEEVSELVAQMNESTTQESEEIQLEKGKNEFTLDIPSTIMFEDGEYELSNPNSKRFIAKIARLIRTMPQSFNIEIMGHTSVSTFTRASLPRDNWDVSALRAISVVKELIKNRIDPSTLKASGYASYHPKSEVAADNRRVEMRFFADDNQEDILSEESFFDRLE